MSGKIILVVDDDQKFLKIVNDALSARGYEVVTAANGAMALKSFQKHKPDLLLVDALLPQMDGFQVCEAIRQETHGKSVPIVMMTAIYKMPNKEMEARSKYGVKDYLTKPIDLAHLLKVVGQLTSTT